MPSLVQLLAVRVTPDLAKAVHAEATRQHMPMAAYVRRVLWAAVEESARDRSAVRAIANRAKANRVKGRA